jgi:ADP-ribose pyrophosphatase YjhB (NUDIX family)
MMKLIRQAAAVPYRRSSHSGYEILLVSRTSGGWGVPKGGIKKGYTPQRAAAMEALEEAGVLGVMEAPLGGFNFRKQGRKHRVSVFPLRVQQVLDRWEEDGERLRVWVALAEAPRFLQRKGLPRLLVGLRHRLLIAAPHGSLRLVA